MPNSFTHAKLNFLIPYSFIILGLCIAIVQFQQVFAGTGPVCNVPAPGIRIQDALYDTNCDIVHILDGTHAVNLQINRSVTLRGSSANRVILDGGGSDSVILVDNNSNVIIHDLTVRNGGGSSGGGIYNSSSTLHVYDVRLIDNQVSSFGGGFFNNYGTVTLERMEISNNTSTVNFHNRGGALHNNQDSALTLINVTMSGNQSTESPGIGNNGALTMTNVTMVNNGANNPSFLGIFNTGAVTMTNSIIYDAQLPNCQGTGTFISLGYNLENGDSCSFNQTGDQINSDPLLKPLTSNGATSTHALQWGSPAIDKGTNSACPSVDQRGVIRPLDGDSDNSAVCDIGAYEATPPTIYLPIIIKP